MKKEHYLITAFMIVVGSLVYIFLVRSSYLSSFVASETLLRQNLSSEYVAENILSVNGEPTDQDSYVFNNVTYKSPIISTSPQSPYKNNVLGAYSGPKKIVVDLSKQRVYAYEGDRLALSFLVSTGKWGATPPGSYRIWYKVRSQTMKGGNPALGTYYYLPNVQFVQYFNKAIGFHSTYWHNNFGTPMSHGCVNMTLADSETLYHWASPTMPSGAKIFRSSSDNPGTPVEVVNSWTI